VKAETTAHDRRDNRVTRSAGRTAVVATHPPRPLGAAVERKTNALELLYEGREERAGTATVPLKRWVSLDALHDQEGANDI
jgi:hypothetical protein